MKAAVPRRVRAGYFANEFGGASCCAMIPAALSHPRPSRPSPVPASAAHRGALLLIAAFGSDAARSSTSAARCKPAA